MSESVASKHRSVVELKLNDGRVEPLCPDINVITEPFNPKLRIQTEWVSLSTPPRAATLPPAESTSSTTCTSGAITPFDIVYYRLRPNYQSAFFYACESGRLAIVEFFLNFAMPPDAQPPEVTGGQPSPSMEATEETMEFEVVMVEPPAPSTYSGRRPTPTPAGSIDSGSSALTTAGGQAIPSTSTTRGEHDHLLVCSTDEQRAALLDQACIFKVRQSSCDYSLN